MSRRCDLNPTASLTDVELEERIVSVKQQMGDSLLILGHHYQQDEVIRFADLRGDSFKLSQLAAASQACRAIVFCGVHFMAETADILSRDEVEVYLPDLAAGCSMADMADLESVEAAWQDLARGRSTPTTSPRSPTLTLRPTSRPSADGTAASFAPAPTPGPCSNGHSRSAAAFCFSPTSTWAGTRPEPWASRSTRWPSGTRANPWAATPRSQIAASRVLLWRGHCSVHQMFKPDHVKQFRSRFPDSKILVHPECMMQVVDAADLVGSTEFIIKTIAQAPAGSTWGVGTELHLVNRLAHENPDKTIHFLSPMVCMCATMYRIDLPHLAWCLENLARGTPVNRIKVPAETAHWARIALERMLEVT